MGLGKKNITKYNTRSSYNIAIDENESIWEKNFTNALYLGFSHVCDPPEISFKNTIELSAFYCTLMVP